MPSSGVHFDSPHQRRQLSRRGSLFHVDLVDLARDLDRDSRWRTSLSLDSFNQLTAWHSLGLHSKPADVRVVVVL